MSVSWDAFSALRVEFAQARFQSKVASQWYFSLSLILLFLRTSFQDAFSIIFIYVASEVTKGLNTEAEALVGHDKVANTPQSPWVSRHQPPSLSSARSTSTSAPPQLASPQPPFVSRQEPAQHSNNSVMNKLTSTAIFSMSGLSHATKSNPNARAFTRPSLWASLIFFLAWFQMRKFLTFCPKFLVESLLTTIQMTIDCYSKL